MGGEAADDERRVLPADHRDPHERPTLPGRRGMLRGGSRPRSRARAGARRRRVASHPARRARSAPGRGRMDRARVAAGRRRVHLAHERRVIGSRWRGCTRRGSSWPTSPSDPGAYRVDVVLPRRMDRDRRRPLSLLADARRRRPPPDRRGHAPPAVGRARRAPPPSRGRRWHRVRGLGPERQVGAHRRRLERVGRARPPDADHGLVGRVGAVRARRRAGPALQVRGERLDGPRRAQGRSARAGGRAPTWHRQHHHRVTSPVERRRLARAARARRSGAPPAPHLRGAPRVVAAGARLPRARRAARGPRGRPRLHARRAAAGGRAPVRRLVGLPGVELLRAHGARTARRTTSAGSSTTSTSAASA